MTSFARSSGSLSGPMRRSFAQSTARSTRSPMSSGSARRSSSSGRNRYSPGSGASPERNITASLPSARSANVAPIIEPRASPSGLSCVATTKRSCARTASATASRSLRVVVAWLIVGNVGEFARELVDQLRHADASLDRRIVFERELRRPLQPELARDARLHDAVRRLEAAPGRAAPARAAERRPEDDAFAQVRRDLHARDGHHPDPGILELPNGLGDDGANGLVDPAHALAHGAQPRWSASMSSAAAAGVRAVEVRFPTLGGERAVPPPPDADDICEVVTRVKRLCDDRGTFDG